jgi:hypothetical protein
MNSSFISILTDRCHARAPRASAIPPTVCIDVSVDELLGLYRNGAGKHGPALLPQKQIERLNRLPEAQQEAVMQMLD